MMDRHATLTELQAGLAEAGASPADNGTVQMIVCRPDTNERLVVERAELDLVVGLIGDNWQTRGSRHTEDGRANPEAQITIMNSRIAQVIAQDRERWQWAGDQLFVDLDLSAENLPPGQRLAIGTAVLEVSAAPHNGCDKFTARFGSDATRFVNSAEGRQARRRGINTRIIQPGMISVGDVVSKIDVASDDSVTEGVTADSAVALT